MRIFVALVLLSLAVGVEARPARQMQPPMLKTGETAAGGFVLGNPKAPIHLTEFMSFTCPHCAHFTEEAAVPLKRDYVIKGKVAYEVRNAVRDIYDLTASLLARCGGAPRFFGNMEAIMASQKDWMTKAADLHLETRTNLTSAQAIAVIADGAGLSEIVRKRGLAPAQIKQCLSNKASQDKIIAMTKDAWDVRKIHGTPSFYINETAQDLGTEWASVAAKLAAEQTAQATATASATLIKGK